MTKINYYTGSKGPVDITTMHGAHLIKAIEKLERMDPDSEELPAMRIQAEKNAADFAAEQAAEEQRRG